MCQLKFQSKIVYSVRMYPDFPTSYLSARRTDNLVPKAKPRMHIDAITDCLSHLRRPAMCTHVHPLIPVIYPAHRIGSSCSDFTRAGKSMSENGSVPLERVRALVLDKISHEPNRRGAARRGDALPPQIAMAIGNRCGTAFPRRLLPERARASVDSIARTRATPDSRLPANIASYGATSVPFLRRVIPRCCVSCNRIIGMYDISMPIAYSSLKRYSRISRVKREFK